MSNRNDSVEARVGGKRKMPDDNINTLIGELQTELSDGSLSLKELKDKLQAIPSDVITDEHLLLHAACLNECNISLKIIECIYNFYPRAMEFSSDDNSNCISPLNVCCSDAYPIHLACYNENCPDSVITFLVNKYPPALKCRCLVQDDILGDHDGWYVEGFPLHYYLSRYKNVNLETVKFLVGEYPESLADTTSTEDNATKSIPLHTIMFNPYVGDLHEVIQYLFEAERSSINTKDGEGQTPLHIACSNGRINIQLVRLLMQYFPGAVRETDDFLRLPLHKLCENKEADSNDLLGILGYLVEEYPGALQQGDKCLRLPIHYAAGSLRPECCKLLVQKDPDSIKTRADNNPDNNLPDGALPADGALPIHDACREGYADTVKYLFSAWPGGTNHRNVDGCFPIHLASMSSRRKAWEKPIRYLTRKKEAENKIRYLVRYNPNCAGAKASAPNNERRPDHNGCLPLHLSCSYGDNLDVAHVLYNAYPAAIYTQDTNGKSPMDRLKDRINDYAKRDYLSSDCIVEKEAVTELLTFLNTQLSYIQNAIFKDFTTPDAKGRLLIHKALHDWGVVLGTVKLILKQNPSAVQVCDKIGAFPLHLACEFSQVEAVQHLAKLYDRGLNVCDDRNDSVLHYACRGGNAGVINYLLLKKKKAAAVSLRNIDNKLPIQLFCEAIENKEESEADAMQQMETIYHLLLADPETVMNW